ncbi:hypothetical protein [Polaromonas sp.]|uniref:hypothetical protein n=1 Tax=Polaromonas sp. TaxID=1869339 RepID=UPI003C95F598
MSDDRQKKAISAAEFFNETARKLLATERGLHAETLVSSVARLAGSLMYRSFGLDPNIEPGATVFSEQAITQGPKLKTVMLVTLQQLGQKIDAENINEEYASSKVSELTFKESHDRLAAFFLKYCEVAPISHLDAAIGAAIATGILIHDCREVLEVKRGAGIALSGFSEGMKTAPYPLNGKSAPDTQPDPSIIPAAPPYSPYTSEAANAIYNMLFCDDGALFRSQSGNPGTSWQKILFSEAADVPALQALALDNSQEGRIRFLAFSRLRRLGIAVPPKVLLGSIVEVPLSGGLDALAAYSEGGVRYVNQSGKLAVIEGMASFLPLVNALLTASKPFLAQTIPTVMPRLPPPKSGSMRMTFLGSDGMYFGEGPMPVLQRDAMAAPVVQHATDLLLAVVAASTNERA